MVSIVIYDQHGAIDEREFWCQEGEKFWRQIVPPEEDRTLFTTALWRGEFRWFRSPNVVALEHYRARQDRAQKSDGDEAA